MFQTLIKPSVAQDYLGDPTWIFVDCRFSLQGVDAGEHAYREAHIPQAVYAHLDRDLSSDTPVTDQGRHPLPSVEQMRERFGRLGITAGKQVVLYDSSNHVFASRMWWMLHYMGHDAAAVLDGGWQAWLDAKLPVESGHVNGTPAVFEGEPKHDWLVQLDDVMQQSLLIDSRSEPRYRGEIEPLDPIAGHIPGALNYFYGQHMQENGRFARSAPPRTGKPRSG